MFDLWPPHAVSHIFIDPLICDLQILPIEKRSRESIVVLILILQNNNLIFKFQLNYQKINFKFCYFQLLEFFVTSQFISFINKIHILPLTVVSYTLSFIVVRVKGDDEQFRDLGERELVLNLFDYSNQYDKEEYGSRKMTLMILK